MAHLYEELAQRVAGWRSAGYPSEENPAVGEILDYGIDDQTGYPRFLRSAQLLALETYWYLRLVEHTPHFQHRLVGRPRAQIRPGLGRYDLPAPPEETIVAVKITDMLGEEVLVTQVV